MLYNLNKNKPWGFFQGLFLLSFGVWFFVRMLLVMQQRLARSRCLQRSFCF
jgi:hypothetical protein